MQNIGKMGVERNEAAEVNYLKNMKNCALFVQNT